MNFLDDVGHDLKKLQDHIVCDPEYLEDTSQSDVGAHNHSIWPYVTMVVVLNAKALG